MRVERIEKMLIVDRYAYKITLYERPLDDFKFKELLTYECAVGAEGYDTPAGLYLINTRSKAPEWKVPDSDWAKEAGLTPGKVYPAGDPNNPIRERWLGIYDGVGIHGTNAYWSIGTRASHGCIRMLPEDIIELYEQVPKYTPIVII